MPKTLEYNHNNDWRDKLLNSWPFLVDTNQVSTLFAFAFCKSTFGWTVIHGNLSQSLFMNGTLFVRYTLSPLTATLWTIGTFFSVVFSAWFLLLFVYGLFIHVSWKETGNRRYLQTGFGQKLNGRIGLIFRIPKNDEQSAKGAHENAPNSNQAPNWTCGTK